MLTSDKVLVTIGTPCSLSAVGTTETYRARVAQAPEFIAYAAFDAGLVDFDGDKMKWSNNGEPATLAEIESRHGAQLRANLGIRSIRDHFASDIELATDIAAVLPHDLDNGGLRRLAGITFRDIRDSAFKDMFGLFDDDPRLAPPLQSQLFVYAGLGALASLQNHCTRLIDNPYAFELPPPARSAVTTLTKQWIRPPKISCGRPCAR